LQFEFDFTADSLPDPPPPAVAAGPIGLLTGRYWQRSVAAPETTVDWLRRELPLEVPVSDRLLAILASRGLTDAPALERFFFPSLSHLHDPFRLAEMDTAVTRLRAAAARGERVAVHGDFDVDGITGCALVWLLLRALTVDGRRVEALPPFVPHRGRDGYGVSAAQIRAWGEAGTHLLITVDTGSAARAEIALARELGMETVVLDHHLYRTRPDAVAVVNPRRPGSDYPNPDLCGVAVAFKLAEALARHDPSCLPVTFAEEVLDLVALGLVADQMPLTGENRTLVHRGLLRLGAGATRRPGVEALLGVAGLDRSFPVTTANLAYQVAPRLNACGRVGDPETALRLLLTDNVVEAAALAQQAEKDNRVRRVMDQRVKEEAVAQAEPFVARGDPGLVLAAPGWHKGVIGISASRLVEQFGRPAVLIAVEGDEARGSARSVPGVDIKGVLDRCSSLLVRWGGHAQAAGMTMLSEDVDRFRVLFLAALADAPGGVPVEPYDLELPLLAMTAGEVAALVSELELLEPFGQGHREPVFRCDGLRFAREPQLLGNSGEHLRFSFRGPVAPAAGGGSALTRDFVAFGSGRAWREAAAVAAAAGTADPRWDILFRLSRSTWRPRSGAAADPVQQHLVDLRPAAAP
jgi:single-stranded-DNA-specific exonuclease